VIDHVWTVFCSRAVIDKRTNNVSIQNIIEQITIKGEPKSDAAIPIVCEVVTLWARADFDVPAQGRLRLAYLSPSGKVLNSMEREIDLSKSRRYRIQTIFQGLPVEEPGRYTFRVELENEDEWHQVATIPLEVVFEPPEETE